MEKHKMVMHFIYVAINVTGDNLDQDYPAVADLPPGYHDQFMSEADSPRVYGVEGTPLNFSRCESPLSQMSFNEDIDSRDKTMIQNTSTPGKLQLIFQGKCWVSFDIGAPEVK